jgi:alkylation response protein AidB-like acyl-CoA dehydrogenase
MSLGIKDEHVELAATVRRFLDSRCPPAVARAGLDAPEELMPPFWAEAAGMGWLGLHVDPSHGGEGFAALPGAGRLASPEPDGGGTLTVSGTIRPVLSAGLADLLVAPVEHPGGVTWCALDLSAASVEVLPSLDPTRRVAAVTFRSFPAARADQLPLDGSQASDVAAALVAAECAGGAGWCVDTAAAYAKVREQFGRPIGQFQAVKHRCAGMLILAEQIRAAAWDAAAVAAAGGEEASLSCSAAGAVAARFFQQVAEDCIQVLGGIGFTWEHDAHRYLRRATTLVALTGGPGPWRRRLAELALSGARRAGATALVPGREELRRSIRREVEAIASLPREKRREALVDAGLFVPHWPPPWGRGAGAAEQIVIDEELERAGVRRENLMVGAWAAPTIAAHGSEEQKERWVRPTLLGQIVWCQLFSEPGAGSDLASLSTRATKCEGGWLLNGQKVWTTMAAEAQYGICLARTNPDAPKHLGITYFVVDMSRPGIEVRPLRELTGHAMFNEVFLTDVFVADTDVVGPVDGGWPLARTTLANERVAMGSGSSFGGGVEALLALASTAAGEADRDELGRLLAEAHCLSMMGRRAALRAVAGAPPGAESSVRKLLGAEHDQRTQEFGLSLLGPEGAVTDGAGAQWAFGFLANRCLTIAGGTSEVQRNVIAERLLGLPRDP